MTGDGRTGGSMILQLDGMTVAYGRKVALRDVSLQLAAGAVGLLGPNGAGKSTLIKTVLGFLAPRSGGGHLLDHDFCSDPLAIRQMVGYMPENEGHIPGMNAVAFVAFAGELAGMARVDAMARSHEVLSYVGLGEARYRPLDTYSTGMRQRIKLAQALIHDPKVLFLDEPTNGMDPKGRREMLDLVKDISVRKRISIVLCSHLLPDVEYACRDVVVLNRGTVVTSGNIEELKARHRQVYQVRGKGDQAKLKAALATAGCDVTLDADRMLRVAMPAGETARFIFQRAADTGYQIRHLMQLRRTLEEVFLDAIGDTSAGATMQVAGANGANGEGIDASRTNGSGGLAAAGALPAAGEAERRRPEGRADEGRE
ncbi:MAG: ATP-binding cassette domain-containing protein [Acidobacteriota bacterium]